MKDSERLEELVDPAVDVLRKAFESGTLTNKELGLARVASSTLSAWSRLKQVERAGDALRFNIARELATDKEQLAEYIRITNPEVPILPAIVVNQEENKKA